MTSQSGLAMDIDNASSGSAAQARAVKVRKFVNADGEEIADSKRSKPMPQPEIKMNAVMLILHWHEYLRAVSGRTAKQPRTHIDKVSLDSSVCTSFHNKFRQQANGKGGIKDKITELTKMRCSGSEMLAGQLEAEMRKIAKLYGLKYDKTPEDQLFNGTVSTLLAMIASYKARFAEARIGTGKFTTGANDLNETYTDVKCFGATPAHHCLMSGITFKPTLQSAQANSLGPGTILINLLNATNSVFQGKWIRAFTQAFAFFPYAADLANYLKGKKGGANPTVTMILNIALLGTTRTLHKATVPASMLLYAASVSKTYVTKMDAPTAATSKLTMADLTPVIRNLDFSGHGFWGLYATCEAADFTVLCNPGMSMRHMQEMIVHAILGTHVDDMSLLHHMTGTQFSIRREMGSTLQARATEGRDVELKLIPFIRVCKLASAAQTQLLTGSAGPVIRHAVLSGFCKRRVDLNDPLLDILKDSSDYLQSNTSQVTIQMALSKVQAEIREKIRSDRMMNYGTTPFFRRPDVIDGATYGAPDDTEMIVTDRLFYSQK